jgi:hypothetical protein
MKEIRIVQDGNIDDSIYPVQLDGIPVEDLEKEDLLWVIHEMCKKLGQLDQLLSTLDDN